jgi:hypothetical protein
MAKVEWHESISIIDGVQLLSVHEVFQVVLHHWALVDGSGLSSGSVDSNTVSEGENVFKSFVLKSIRININNTLIISNA